MHPRGEKCAINFNCKPQRKRQFGGCEHSLKDKITMGLKEAGCEGVGWICVAQVTDRWWALTDMVMNHQVP
jgi:hypothetical protein